MDSGCSHPGVFILHLQQADCTMMLCCSLGADGVMVPLVNSKADAEQAVSYCLFPPEGQRSAAYPVRCVALPQAVNLCR